MEEKPRPVPIPTSITRRYWENVNSEALRIPKCRDCGALHFYPHALCPNCMSPNLDDVPVSGNGTVYSYTVIRSPQPAFKGMEPYVVANIELDEGVRMMANVLTDDVESVGIGTRVRLVYQQVADDLKMPQFEPI
jgi:hypothetical protein